MATAEQFQNLLDLFKQQMETITALRDENQGLRDANGTAGGTTGGTASATDVYKPKKPERPIIHANIDDQEWAIVEDSWGRYKKMCRLNEADVESIRLELRECCSPEVNKFLFEYVGPTKLNACSEAELLTHIKSVAVKVVHKEVHRMAFNMLFQDHGESVTQWIARVKAQAFLCDFKVPCTCCVAPNGPAMISYAEEEIAQRVVAGLYNQEHQRRILSEASTLTTLEMKEKRLKVLEATEQSAQSLHRPSPQSPSDAAAGRSQYKASKVPPKVPEHEETADKCRGCGAAPHQGGRKKCTAFNKICRNCKMKGHLARVCENTNAASTEVPQDTTHNPNISALPPLQSDASVSFSFRTEVEDGNQDFHGARRRTDET